MTEPHIPVPGEVASGEILRVLVGSTLHGTGVPEQEDTDYMGVCVEPWQAVLGLSRFDQWTWRTQPEGQRSGPGDIDITIYGLGKFLTLALACNPSILLALFVPEEHQTVTTEWGRQLQELRSAIISKRAVETFSGYLRAQMDRLDGIRGGAHTNRPELIGEHGYDTKYAMHALRLAYQGAELLGTGWISLPVPDPWGETLRSVRRGEVPYCDFRQLLEEAKGEMGEAASTSSLPDVADLERVERFAADCRLTAWSSMVFEAARTASLGYLAN